MYGYQGIPGVTDKFEFSDGAVENRTPGHI